MTTTMPMTTTRTIRSNLSSEIVCVACLMRWDRQRHRSTEIWLIGCTYSGADQSLDQLLLAGTCYPSRGGRA